MSEEKLIKVEKWDHNAVRIALDDAAKKAILELDYEENFKLIDTRLIISTTAVAFALFALAWDFFYPFPTSQPVLLICALSYFALMGVFTIHATFKEKNIFLVAHQKDIAGTDPDIVWTLSSTMVRFDKEYTLTITVEDGAGQRDASFTKSVGNFIDDDGQLQYDIYRPMVVKLHDSLASSKKME